MAFLNLTMMMTSRVRLLSLTLTLTIDKTMVRGDAVVDADAIVAASDAASTAANDEVDVGK